MPIDFDLKPTPKLTRVIPGFPAFCLRPDNLERDCADASWPSFAVIIVTVTGIAVDGVVVNDTVANSPALEAFTFD